MQRGALVAALNARRDNDVYVRVPFETGGYVRLALVNVVYNSDDDTIDIVTEGHLDGPDESGGDAG
jgi:hypothetical protein